MKKYKFLFVTDLTRSLSTEFGEDLGLSHEKLLPFHLDFDEIYDDLVRRSL